MFQIPLLHIYRNENKRMKTWGLPRKFLTMFGDRVRAHEHLRNKLITIKT